jgi:phosphatidylinositol-4,5-bisphosphate 4-phosphatase
MSGAHTTPQQTNSGTGRSANRVSIGNARRMSEEIQPADLPDTADTSASGSGGSAHTPLPPPRIMPDERRVKRHDAFFQELGIGPVALEKFRDGKGKRLVVGKPANDKSVAVLAADLSFKQRYNASKKDGLKGFEYGTPADREQNKEAKQAFNASLEKATGEAAAKAALNAAKLGPDWAKSDETLSKKRVCNALDKAQQVRVKILAETDDNFLKFLRGSDESRGLFSKKVKVDPNASPCMMKTFRQACAVETYPAADRTDPEMTALVRRGLREHPDFGKDVIDLKQMDTIAQGAIRKFYDQKKDRFRGQHPGLAQFAGHLGAEAPRQDNRSFLQALQHKMDTGAGDDPGAAEDEARAPTWARPRGFRELAQKSLQALGETGELLNTSAYEPRALDELHRELDKLFFKLRDLEMDLGNMADADQPNSNGGQSLKQGLIDDLRHNKETLLAKLGFLDDVKKNNPESEKAVAYSNLLWAEAAGHIFDRAAQKRPAGAEALGAAKTRHIEQRTEAYEAASKTEPPEGVEAKTHPVVAGKVETVDYLKAQLKAAGVPSGEIKKLTSKDSLAAARREALNQNQDWAPIERDMVVTKDGETRTYQSKITPACHINNHFRQLYQGNTAAQPQAAVPGQPQSRPRSVSALEKANPTHPRNMKVSELQKPGPDGQPVTLAKVVGHGVLDMWEIADPERRKAANESAAHEVLEAAISVNDRIRQTATQRALAGNADPVKITHVSLNLTTPSPGREIPVVRSMFPDHQELTYTEEQFRAFEASSAGKDGGPAAFKVDNPAGANHPALDIKVEVDPITFSFGINPWSTKYGTSTGTQEAFAGWNKVYEHNKIALTKLIGDLGSTESSIGPRKVGAVGTTPGGFIGSAYERLNPEEDPQHEEMAAKLRHQTNVVRAMFTNEDFRKGNGDPAKMGREILALHAYAEQALALTGATDQAATMSRGCKSDKDRGGVTDVELKHKLITEDFGGQILPDKKLSPDDQANYNAVAVASGQFENQALNTGVPGSKEAGKLDKRIPDAWLRGYLKGMGKFAEE